MFGIIWLTNLITKNTILTMTNKIFVGLAAGIVIGSISNEADLSGSLIESACFFGLFDIIGKIFVASLKLLVVPMVFVSLPCGTASLRGHGRMGIMASTTIGLYLMTTALAISIALSLAVIIPPATGHKVETDANFQASTAPP